MVIEDADLPQTKMAEPVEKKSGKCDFYATLSRSSEEKHANSETAPVGKPLFYL